MEIMMRHEMKQYRTEVWLGY